MNEHPGLHQHMPDGSVQRICLLCRRHRLCPWVGEIPWRRAWQPTPVFLPGKSHRERSLAGYSPWGCKESHRTELLTFTFTLPPANPTCSHVELCVLRAQEPLSALWTFSKQLIQVIRCLIEKEECVVLTVKNEQPKS